MDRMNKYSKRNQDLKSKDAKKIEIVEERLVVDKKKVEKGSVVLHKRVIEEDIPLDLNLTEEHIDIEVKKIGEVVDKLGPPMREEGDTTIYSVYREIYVKQIILEEEVRITKKLTKKPFHTSEKLRREVVDVERVSGDRKEHDHRDPIPGRQRDRISGDRYEDDRPRESKDNRSGERYSGRGSQGDYPGYNRQGDLEG
jgi:stress response protein YsnF